MYLPDSGPGRAALSKELRRLAPQWGFLLLVLLIWFGVLPLWRWNQQQWRSLQSLRQENADLEQLRLRAVPLQLASLRAQEQLRQTAVRFAPPNILDRVLLDLVTTARTLPNLNLRRYNYRANGTVLVEDDRYGAALKGRLLQNTIELELEGDFASTLTYLASLEQRIPRLVLSGFSTELDKSAPTPGRIITRMNVTAISLISPTQADTYRRQAETDK